MDKHGNPIDLTPSILLVSTDKKRDADNLCNRTTVTVAGDPASTKQLRVSNEFLGQFEPVASPYMQAPSISGASANKWFLFAQPSADVAVIEIAYLDGRRYRSSNRPTPISTRWAFNSAVIGIGALPSRIDAPACTRPVPSLLGDNSLSP